MPKRPNPFGEASPLQMKSHIGKKEVDMGVGMDENMMAVYERTKSLLYEGSRKLPDCTPCDEWTNMTREDTRLLPGQLRLDPEGHLCTDVSLNTEPTTTLEVNNEGNIGESVDVDMETPAVASTSVSRSPIKQLQIDLSGRLCSGIRENVAAQASTSPGFRICHCCNRPSHISTRPCNFCDKATCNNCIYQCCNCQGLHCRICSVLNYDDRDERPFCLQCRV